MLGLGSFDGIFKVVSLCKISSQSVKGSLNKLNLYSKNVKTIIFFFSWKFRFNRSDFNRSMTWKSKKETDRQTNRDRQTDRDRQTGRQTDRKIDRLKQTERQTDWNRRKADGKQTESRLKKTERQTYWNRRKHANWNKQKDRLKQTNMAEQTGTDGKTDGHSEREREREKREITYRDRERLNFQADLTSDF